MGLQDGVTNACGIFTSPSWLQTPTLTTCAPLLLAPSSRLPANPPIPTQPCTIAFPLSHSQALREMERCARALARSVGYQGAATVEYLYSIEEKKYYFLELNPRYV